MKKSIVAGFTAMALLISAGGPVNAKADAPPFFQYEGESFPVVQIGQYDSLAGLGGTEIIAYDAISKQAYVTNGAEFGIDILSFDMLQNGKFTKVESKKRINLKDFGLERVKDITSIAVHPSADLIAISVVSNPSTDRGYIVFLTKDGTFLTSVQVGSLPDMVTFTPDGKKAIVANEGEPNADYSIDPEGSISIIDIPEKVSKDTKINAKTLTFENVPLDEKVRVSSKGTILQQLEPEFVAVSEDSKTAYVALQENNAIAIVDLENDKIIDVKGLGMKDHSVLGNELDAKRDGKTVIEKFPLLGFYMPDGIDMFTSDGRRYILSPNEGDSRDYDGYSEEVKIKKIRDDIQLKAEHYKGYTQEELDKLVANGLLDDLADILVTNENGIVNGKYESLHTFGARSFTIFDADTMKLVYDSSSDFERIIVKALPEHFNTNNNELAYDKRSSSKGPEPETVVQGTIGDKRYAFIALERLSGIMVYDITKPEKAKFVTLISSRDFSEGIKGDVSPEGLQFVSANESPTGLPLLLAAHEVSGTVAIYEFGSKAILERTKSNWASDYIGELIKKDIIKNSVEKPFIAQNNLSQKEFLKLLSLTLNLTNEEDILLSGFISDKKITRAQMATIIVKAFEFKTGNEVKVTNEKKYKDISNIDDIVKEDVQKAYELGFMEGRENGNFSPNEFATQAHAAKVLSLLLNVIQN